VLIPTRAADVDYLAEGLWQDRTLSSFLDHAAECSPEAVAVRTDAGDVSYGELRASVAQLAAVLRQRWVQPHDVVTVFLPNWFEALQVIHAITWAGCVVSPVVTTYRRAELSFILSQSHARVIVIPHVFRGFDFVALLSEVLADLADPPTVIVVRPQGELPRGFIAFDELRGEQQVAATGKPSDVCLLLYTSGTTSVPKGVLHSHHTIGWEMRSIIDVLELDADDGTFMASPIGHLTGIVYGVYLPTLLSQSVALLDIWDARQAADMIERHGCRVSLGATPFLAGLVGEYERRGVTSSLRIFICGGADVPVDLVACASKILDCRVTRTYGLSEMPTFSISGATASGLQCAQTDGTPIRPAAGYLLNPVGGVGELVVRGPELFLGYLDPALNEGVFTDDGFFRTGDLVEFGEAGALSVRGRVKDVIIRGGENISALEIEEYLLRHNAIQDAAVVGYPDAVMGERVAAFLVVEAGEVLSPSAIGAYLQACGVAAHKRPERIHVVTELPRTASGKVQKQLLRQQTGQHAD